MGFYTPNNYHSITDESIIRKAWMISIIVAVSVLIATITFSIWNAFRYGGPYFSSPAGSGAWEAETIQKC